MKIGDSSNKCDFNFKLQARDTMWQQEGDMKKEVK
jgi:hypothetical protein